MHRSPWSVFRKPQFFHTFSVILILSNYRKCMGKPKFSKNRSRTPLHSRFSALFVWTRNLPFSKRKHQIYEFRKKEFPAILPWLPMIQLWVWTLDRGIIASYFLLLAITELNVSEEITCKRDNPTASWQRTMYHLPPTRKIRWHSIPFVQY